MKKPDIGYIRLIVLIISSSIWTVYYSLQCIVFAFFNKLSRAKMNEIIYFWSRKVLKLVDARVHCIGNQEIIKHFKSQNRNIIILCSHSSHYDIPVTFQAIQNQTIRMVAKESLFKIPVFGKAIEVGEFAPVSRTDKKAIIKNLAYARKLMESGVILWVAPEGSRSIDGNLQPFKKGAFYIAANTQSVIIPIALSGVNKIAPAKSLNINFHKDVVVNIGTPFDLMDFNKNDIGILIDDVYQEMKSLLLAADSELQKIQNIGRNE